jgi:GNAT superfamily N-acetyltransferase
VIVMSGPQSTALSARGPDSPRLAPVSYLDELAIGRLDPAQFAAAAGLLARAFVANPLHVALFGHDAVGRNQAFFAQELSENAGTWLAAFERQQLVGVVHWSEGSDECVARPRQTVGLWSRLARFLSRTASGEPDTDDVEDQIEHRMITLGPVGVLPERRGQGIGGMLVSRFCAVLDAERWSARLETDRADNVRFYSRFDFRTVRESAISGVKTYVMDRPRLAD